MRPRTRPFLMLLALLLVTGVWWNARDSQSSAMGAAVPGAPSLFSKEQISHFLASVKAAEALADPLRRCLDYPDPPGSHWSHEVVVVVCKRSNETPMTFDQAKALVDSGHASDLDRHLADLANGRNGYGHPADDVHYALAYIFDNSSDRVRALVDAWKRQSPGSAYAYAGSGMAYVAAGVNARGEDFVSSTPDAQLEAMEHLFELAEADLTRAIAIDAKCLSAYSEMVIIGRNARPRAYGLDAVRRGLAIEPDSYAIHSEWLALSNPEWGGTARDVLEVVEHARHYDKSNPLLVLVETEGAAIAADLDHCDCGTPEGRLAFARAFDNVAGSNATGWAGKAANSAGQYDLGLVYLSETLRFRPNAVDFALSRVNSLLAEGDHAYAMSEAQRALALAPRNQRSYLIRGSVYDALNDYVHAAADYRTALTLPGEDDAWIMDALGEIYVHKTHEWDKGWDIADQLIQTHPDDPSGWFLRLCIQQDQPRPGAHDTATYVLAHFSDDPRAAPAIAQVKAMLAQEKH
jgi:tetratricopeptide (TPR) repeat protein